MVRDSRFAKLISMRLELLDQWPHSFQLALRAARRSQVVCCAAQSVDRCI